MAQAREGRMPGLSQRLPLAELPPNSPQSSPISGKHIVNDSASTDVSQVIACGRVHELRDRYSRPGSPLILQQSSALDFDIHIDADHNSDIDTLSSINAATTRTTTSTNESHLALATPPMSRLRKVNLQSNLTTATVQTKPAEPIAKSHPPQLSPTHAQSPHPRMTDTPARQQSLDTKAAAKADRRQQQGQGDRSYSPLSLQTSALHSSTDLPEHHSGSPSMPANTPSKRSVSNKENLQPKLTTPLNRSTSRYDALEAAVVEAATPPVPQSTPHSPTQAARQLDLPPIEKLNIASPAPATKQKPADPAVEQTSAPTKIVEQQLPMPVHQLSALTETVEQPAAIDAQESELVQQQPSTVEELAPADSKPQPQPKMVGEPVVSSALKPAPSPPVRKAASPPRSKKDPGPRPTKASMARMSLAHGTETAKAPAWGRPRQISDQTAGPAAQRITSNGSNVSNAGEKKEVSIPHSKPRPMSMSFPMPAPLAKSAKAPTRPTFQLPGEAVAQKLKEARELREKKDDDKKVFKARAVPASVKAGAAVRQTNTSRARESLGLGKELVTPKSGSLHSRASSVAVVRPADRRTSVTSSRATSSGSDKPSALGVSGRLCNAKRAASSLANIGKPRDASPTEIAAKTAVAKPAPASGKEVYNRHIFASEAAEREKRDKEEATKKARAEAAERSRILSREWAAKKRQQQTVLKADVQV